METRFYEWIVYLYGISIILYFADFMRENKRLSRIAFSLLILVWGLLTFFFMMRMVRLGHFPIFTPFETLFFFSWILITLSLLFHWIYQVHFFLFFFNLVGFAAMVLSLFSSPGTAVDHGTFLTDRLVVIHVTFALTAYALFLASAVLSVMVLLLNRLLKKKRWTPLLRRLPSLEPLSRLTLMLILFGVPIYLISIILGLIWAFLVFKAPFFLDVKVWLSFLVLGIYAFYLYAAKVRRWSSLTLSIWNLLFFLIVIANFLSSASISMFHPWL